MNAESIVIAFLIGGGIWFILQMNRKRRLEQVARARDEDEPSPEERGSMPRVGVPGTLTKAQIRVLQSNGFVYDKGWSKEEAALILDTLAYLRAVCRHVAPDVDAPVEVQNELLSFILVHDDLRDHLRGWSEARRMDRDDAYLEASHEDLPEGDALTRIAQEANRLLAPHRT